MTPVVYQYPTCSTCRKALRWLREQGIEHESVHIVERPPSEELLRKALALGVPLKKLFNTSGESYKAGKLKDRLPNMTEAQALRALAADGKLVKRPFVVTGEQVLTGFDEGAWQSAFSKGHP